MIICIHHKRDLLLPDLVELVQDVETQPVVSALGEQQLTGDLQPPDVVKVGSDLGPGEISV